MSDAIKETFASPRRSFSQAATLSLQLVIKDAVGVGTRLVRVVYSLVPPP